MLTLKFCPHALLCIYLLLRAFTDVRKECSILRGKCLAANVNCHCWKSKREQNERKQVHLPQVYNPEITVCSEAALTTLRTACASLLISLAPAVQELIWRFSESITLLSGAHIACGWHPHTGMKNKCSHTNPLLDTHVPSPPLLSVNRPQMGLASPVSDFVSLFFGDFWYFLSSLC